MKARLLKYGVYPALAYVGVLLFYATGNGFVFDFREVDYDEGLSDLSWSDDSHSFEFYQNELFSHSTIIDFHQWGKSIVLHYDVDDSLIEMQNIVDRHIGFYEPIYPKQTMPSPDGSLNAVWYPDQLVLTDVETGDKQRIHGSFTGISTFQWSPDGSKIAVIAHFHRVVYLIDVKSGESRRIYKMPLTRWHIWNPIQNVWYIWAAIAPLCFIPAVRAIKFRFARGVIWIVYGLYYLLCLGLFCLYATFHSW